MATVPPQTESTPDVVGATTSTPHTFVSSEHSFTLQAVFELQKSMGQLTEAVNSLKVSIDNQSNRIQRLEDKLSGVTHKLYAAGVVLTIILVIGGWMINKAWDFMIGQIAPRPGISSPAEQPRQVK